MSSISRATMPANFYDETSDMLLVEPEPQFLYAQLYLAALALSLEVPPTMGPTPMTQIGGTGAMHSPAERDRLILSTPIAQGAIAAKFDFKGKPGSTIKLNRPVFTNSTATEASRRIPSGTSISTTGMAPGQTQTSLTLFNYGGPYNDTTGAIAPYAIEDFDAQMGIHDPVSTVGAHLKRDFHRFLDTVNVQLLDLASEVDRPAGMNADDDASVVGQFPFTYELLSRVGEEMDTAKLPTFADGFRMFVGTPKQMSQLKSDKQYREAASFHPQYNILFPNYVASVDKFHIFRSTTLTASNNSNSVPIHRGHAIAPGALLGGMGRRPRVTPSDNTNYQNSVSVIWQGDLAFGLADDRFVRSVRSSA